MFAASLSGCIILAPSGLLGGQSDYREVELQSGSRGKKILVLDIDGVISSGANQSPGLFSAGDSTVNEVAEKLAKARRDKSIKAVILRVDTPGGGVTASDVIYRMLKEYKDETKVPVYASMLDMATSGGYYVSMAADHVYAHPTTITGSIGVIAIFPQFQDMGKKIGLYAEVIKSGANKDLSGGFVNMSPEQRAILQQMIDEMYDRFVEVVKEGRKDMPEEEIRRLADGRVYTAKQAVDNKLIDGIKYTDEVIKQAREDLGAKKAQVVLYRRTGRENVSSFYAKSGDVAPTAQAGDTTNLSLVHVDASSLSLPGVGQPVFHYMWTP
jgi:protease-4